MQNKLIVAAICPFRHVVQAAVEYSGYRIAAHACNNDSIYPAAVNALQAVAEFKLHIVYFGFKKPSLGLLEWAFVDIPGDDISLVSSAAQDDRQNGMIRADVGNSAALCDKGRYHFKSAAHKKSPYTAKSRHNRLFT